MDDFEEYEIKCEIIRQDNSHLLEEFMVWMRREQLTEKTIQKHVNNIDLYINEFELIMGQYSIRNTI